MTDTLFVILASAFTGVGDTRTPMVVSLVWNWGTGMPLAYVLAFRFGHGLSGLWTGRIAASIGAEGRPRSSAGAAAGHGPRARRRFTRFRDGRTRYDQPPGEGERCQTEGSFRS